MPSSANRATSVQPSFGRGVPPVAATNAAATGASRPGRGDRGYHPVRRLTVGAAPAPGRCQGGSSPRADHRPARRRPPETRGHRGSRNPVASDAMGKASKKKAQRRQGTGESQAKFEQGRATGRQERIGLQASQALSELAGIARSLEQPKTENVRAWWGG